MYLINRPIFSGRIARHLLLLQEYDFEIVYKSKCQHVMADHLFRIAIEEAPMGLIDTFLDINLFMIQINLKKVQKSLIFIVWQISFIYF